MSPVTAILLIHCPDQSGLVAAVTAFIHRNHGNVLDLDQHVDGQQGVFFMRVAWEVESFDLAREEIGPAFAQEIGDPMSMTWRLHFSDERPRMAVFVSKLSHCLYDILSRQQSGEWKVDIPVVVSNHARLETVADSFGIPFRRFEVTPQTKAQVEQEQLALLAQHDIDLVVLARYMQVLSDDFVSRFNERLINIHHSFLPAFPGAKPYHSAHERGVKLIGATSHYVTAELDAGPIIEQDVVHVTHRQSVSDLIRKGRDLEKVVLARAIWHHLQRRTLVYANRTVVFA